MLKSMTGYGKATSTWEEKNITIEMRSVNGKSNDMSLRMPALYKEKEMEIRNEISRLTQRGKIDLTISCEQNEPDKAIVLNQPVILSYYEQIKSLANQTGVPITSELLVTALRMPDATKVEMAALSDDEWITILKCIQAAFENFDQFRVKEGKVLEEDILKRVDMIEQFLKAIEPFEKQRINKIRERIGKNLNDFIDAASIDANRFEQEVIYYLEKIDITEEKVRLKNHCKYFRETLNGEESTGRKLGFIAQEMGREINTIGSKANDSDMQQLVIRMKDELEKIKEQLMNIL
jgi:uncharacterized protein (TIGR00255 family)